MAVAEKKTSWGGKRPGAGRKKGGFKHGAAVQHKGFIRCPTNDGSTVRVAFRYTMALKERLAQEQKQNENDTDLFIRLLSLALDVIDALKGIKRRFNKLRQDDETDVQFFRRVLEAGIEALEKKSSSSD